MGGPFTFPVAEAVPLLDKDSRDNDFKSENVQDGMEETDFRRETLELIGFNNLTDSVVSFNEVTREAKIEPTNNFYDYYMFGCLFRKTGADTVIIPDTHGVHILYLDNVGTGNFISYTGAGADKPYNQGEGTEGAVNGTHELKVCVIYWDATNKKAILSLDARSLLSMPWALQRRSHFVTRVEHGVSDFNLENITTDGDGTLDSDAQFSFSAGKVFHEDAMFTVVDTATPVNQFEQDLGGVSGLAKIPIYYRSGTGNAWFKKTANGFPLYDDTGNTIFYNEDVAGAWQLTNAPENSFVAIYYFATININEPVIGILGDHVGASPAQSTHKHLLSPKGLPFPAMGFIKAVIFQTSTSFTNSANARVFGVSDVLDTLSNDRYAVTGYYGGNANTGRWLEFANSESSDNEPLLIPEDSFIRTITLNSTAIIDIGKKIGFFEASDLVTPRFEITVPVGGLKVHQFDVTEFFNKGEEISVQVTLGNISKPVVRFWIETTA